MTKIAHLTSAHPRYDTRIFQKMCSSLADQGQEVTLVVGDGKGDETQNGVRIVDVGASEGRLDRMVNAPKRVFSTAAALEADLYHLHDPELIRIGVKLKHLGHRVVFDSHEDIPKQILEKPYLGKTGRWTVSKLFAAYEASACEKLDGVIAATPFIREKFSSINPNTVDINNFPLKEDLRVHTRWEHKSKEVSYVGGISKIRGIFELCLAMEQTRSGARLNLAGCFGESALRHTVQAMSGWRRVNALGFIDRKAVRDVLGRSMAGLVTFHPAPNHIEAQPNKMFEYMSAGIPVIASDFPLWREICVGNDCGLVVDPMDPSAIAESIDALVSNPAMARRMGENGRHAIEERYNWSSEEQKLFLFYEKILQNTV